jgi:hypothetical protein
MKTALTLIRRHGSDSLEILTGNEVKLPIQLAGFKALQRENEHPQWAEAQFWVSDRGMTKRKKFQPAAEESSPKRKRKTTE